MDHLRHIRLDSVGRLVLAPTPEALLALVLLLSRVVGGRLLLFGLAADHLHIVVRIRDARDLGALMSALRRAFARAGMKLSACDVRPVDGADHLGTLVNYGPRQPWKHQLVGDPLLHVGSHLPDVLAARRLPGFGVSRIQGELPAADLAATVLAGLGITEVPSPADDALVRRLGATQLWNASRRALAVERIGRTENGELLAPAFVQVGRAAGIAGAELMHASGLSRASCHRVRATTLPDGVANAVRMQLALVDLAERVPPSVRKVPPASPKPILRRRAPGRSA